MSLWKQVIFWRITRFIFNYVFVTSFVSDYVHIPLEVHNKHFFCSEFAKRFVTARTEALESEKKIIN